MTRTLSKLLSSIVFLLAGLIGILAFFQPFWGVSSQASEQNSPLTLTVLIGLCLLALLIEVQGQSVSAKVVAALGILVAITSVLRFAEVALPGPGGFSPIFAPIMLAAYVFGARFGFLMGAFTLLVSALVTGGVGPWLPYQMFTAGWVGLTAGWLGLLLQRRPRRRALLGLMFFGFGWGMLYGVVMNLFFWPYAVGPAEQSWRPGSELGEVLRSFGVFYPATSVWWDLMRGLGNAVLIAILGLPTLRALSRFRDRFQFDLVPEPPA